MRPPIVSMTASTAFNRLTCEGCTRDIISERTADMNPLPRAKMIVAKVKELVC